MGLQGKADLDNAPAQQNKTYGTDQTEDEGAQVVDHHQRITGSIGGHSQTQDHCAGEHSTAVAAKTFADGFGHGQAVRSPMGGRKRSNGFLTLAGGIIITFAKEILDLIVA